MKNVDEWSHVFKLDPNKEISDEQLEAVCESGTDAIIVGGTDGITLDNTLSILVRVRRYPVTVALEVSALEAITPGFDYYMIPSVMNSQDVEWILGQHHAAVKDYGELIQWDELIIEGYCVLNKDAKVAQLTNATTELTEDDVLAYARLAENMYRFPFFYLEYSGMQGSVELVERVQNVLKETKLIYGGGITTAADASKFAKSADVVVIGDAIYTDLNQALKTVQAVKEVRGGV
ncbi:putative glycerol-1-phosphate prenyltransferase [Alkalihalobacillus xiaoxiensis]|uniref:Heptaprenylglyceryl phosphate synthase n=1 Tax=Shouchella xiaoxiensis TaxID=766895 RepID=A0ABS2SUT8_9BACI|nr:heptaprenylglyceryl phosphate synthase [Shouchella xiaoxiensis]MBM7839015.1 putative glycerol-1-phosphate prenyltransferase [Shouchella xiaoxiensis]